MLSTKKIRAAFLSILAASLACSTVASGQQAVTDPAAGVLPNPNPTVIKNWAKLPNGREWGSTAGIDIGPDGHIWTYDRCGAIGLDGGCDVSNVDPILKIHRDTGEVLAHFGAGEFVLPHGIHVDRDGNVWVTDSMGNAAHTKGHQVIKFSPEGQVLLRLGRPGMAGRGPGLLNEPCDVITAANGDIFVADGHSGQSGGQPPEKTGRILKFDKNGRFIKEWGEIGEAPGQFKTPHALALDSRGRLLVADRGNHRIQIFDQDGNYIESLYQYGRVSGLFVTADDTLYAIDSESSTERHPGWKTGIRIGKVNEDRVTAFVPPHETDEWFGAAGEGVAVDAAGNLYGAEGPLSRAAAGGGITKYVR